MFEDTLHCAAQAELDRGWEDAGDYFLKIIEHNPDEVLRLSDEIDGDVPATRPGSWQRILLSKLLQTALLELLLRLDRRKSNATWQDESGECNAILRF